MKPEQRGNNNICHLQSNCCVPGTVLDTKYREVKWVLVKQEQDPKKNGINIRKIIYGVETV